MSRALILGRLDRDLACAVALGLVEDPRVVANSEAVTLHDGQLRPLGTERGWLQGDAPRDAAPRDYLRARSEAVKASSPSLQQSAWRSASAVRARDDANSRARQA